MKRKDRANREQEYHDALKLIATGFETTDELRRKSESLYGLDYVDALEMAYENLQEIAKGAIGRKRRPTDKGEG